MATKGKGKLRGEQDAGMDVYADRYTAAHARHLRKVGKGNRSEGLRMLIEQDMQRSGPPVERRKGPGERRKWKG